MTGFSVDDAVLLISLETRVGSLATNVFSVGSSEGANSESSAAAVNVLFKLSVISADTSENHDIVEMCRQVVV